MKPAIKHPCPKCGFEMCEQFDEKPGPHGSTLAVPNGKYFCYRCKSGDFTAGAVGNSASGAGGVESAK